MRRFRTRAGTLGAAALGAAVIAAIGSIAWAAIPNAAGVINGCYEKRTGILRVIDAEAGKSCLSFESAIWWNRQGPQGPAGIQGPAGPQGPRGEPGDSLTSIEALQGASCGQQGTVSVQVAPAGDIILHCTPVTPPGSNAPDPPQLTSYELDQATVNTIRVAIQDLNARLEDLTRLLPTGPFHLPSSILNADVFGVRVVSEPGAELDVYVSANCGPDTDWLSVLRAELETTIPTAVLAIAELGLSVVVDMFVGDEALRVPPGGQLELPVLSFGTADTFSMTATNAAGTSGCSNAVTAP